MPFDADTGREARAKASPRGESKLKKLFREYADADDVKGLFDKLLEMSNDGNLDAIKLMLSYLIGKPKETKEVILDAEITEKRPSWFRPKEAMPLNVLHTSIISTSAKSELQ